MFRPHFPFPMPSFHPEKMSPFYKSPTFIKTRYCQYYIPLCQAAVCSRHRFKAFLTKVYAHLTQYSIQCRIFNEIKDLYLCLP